MTATSGHMELYGWSPSGWKLEVTEESSWWKDGMDEFLGSSQRGRNRELRTTFQRRHLSGYTDLLGPASTM